MDPWRAKAETGRWFDWPIDTRGEDLASSCGAWFSSKRPMWDILTPCLRRCHLRSRAKKALYCPLPSILWDPFRCQVSTKASDSLAIGCSRRVRSGRRDVGNRYGLLWSSRRWCHTDVISLHRIPKAQKMKGCQGFNCSVVLPLPSATAGNYLRHYRGPHSHGSLFISSHIHTNESL